VPGLLRTAFCSGFSTSTGDPATSRVPPVLKRRIVDGRVAMSRSFHGSAA
jgi:hypothetical protein